MKPHVGLVLTIGLVACSELATPVERAPLRHMIVTTEGDTIWVTMPPCTNCHVVAPPPPPPDTLVPPPPECPPTCIS